MAFEKGMTIGELFLNVILKTHAQLVKVGFIRVTEQ